MTSYKNPKF